VLLLVAFVTAASAFTTPFLRGFGSQSLGPAAPFSRPAVGLAKLRAEVDGQSMDAESELERLKQRAAAALKAAEEAEKRYDSAETEKQLGPGALHMRVGLCESICPDTSVHEKSVCTWT